MFQGAAGYTDNVFSSPNEPIEEVPDKQADALAIVSPGVVYSSIGGTEMHRFGYTVTGNFFLTTARGNTVSNRLEYAGLFALARGLDLTLGAGATQDQFHTSNTFVSSTATTLRSLFPGIDAFLVLRADEALRFELSRDIRGFQSSGVGYQMPLFIDADMTTFTVRNRLGFDYIFRTEAIGPEGRLDYSGVRNAVGPGGVPIGTQRVLAAGGTLRWRSDWGRYFTSRVEAGAMHVSFLDHGSSAAYPIGGASLFYTDVVGEAVLAYDRTVATSLFLGQTFLIDEVRLRGSVPLDEDEDFWLSASAGVQRGRLLDIDGTLATPVNVLLGDVSLAWRAHDNLTLSARYQHIQQDSEAERPPLPLSFTRNIAMVTARLTFPRDDDMPAPYRAPQRVDQQDEVRMDGPMSVGRGGGFP